MPRRVAGGRRAARPGRRPGRRRAPRRRRRVVGRQRQPHERRVVDLLLGRVDARPRIRDRPLRGRARRRDRRPRRRPPARPGRSRSRRRPTPSASAPSRPTRSTPSPPSSRPGPYGSVTVVVDRTPPTISASLQPVEPEREQQLVPQQPGRSTGPAPTPAARASPRARPTRPSNTQGAGQRRTGQAPRPGGQRQRGRELAGLQPRQRRAARRPRCATPSPGRDGRARADLRLGAGIRQRHLRPRPLRGDGAHRAGATAPSPAWPHRAARASTGRARQSDIFSSPFPDNTELRWYVRTYDRAGNAGGSESRSRAFRIDPTVPGPPSVHRRPERAHQRRRAHVRLDRQPARASPGACGGRRRPRAARIGQRPADPGPAAAPARRRLRRSASPRSPPWA